MNMYSNQLKDLINDARKINSDIKNRIEEIQNSISIVGRPVDNKDLKSRISISGEEFLTSVSEFENKTSLILQGYGLVLRFKLDDTLKLDEGEYTEGRDLCFGGKSLYHFLYVRSNTEGVNTFHCHTLDKSVQFIIEERGTLIDITVILGNPELVKQLVVSEYKYWCNNLIVRNCIISNSM